MLHMNPGTCSTVDKLHTCIYTQTHTRTTQLWSGALWLEVKSEGMTDAQQALRK